MEREATGRAARAADGLLRFPQRQGAQRAGDITRENIINAFWKLYRSGGPVSVKRVMEAAGYQRSTFYLHFSSVRDVLDYIEDQLVCRERVMELQVRFLTAGLPVEALLEQLAPLLEGTLPIWAALLGEDGDPALARLCEALWRPVILARLERRYDAPPDWRAARADFLFFGCLGAFARMAQQNPAASGREVTDALLACLRMQGEA